MRKTTLTHSATASSLSSFNHLLPLLPVFLGFLYRRHLPAQGPGCKLPPIIGRQAGVRVKKVRTILFLLAFFTGAAEAHRDRLLHIEADGSIQDIPVLFGPVRLIVEGLGSENPLIQLKIGTKQTTLPACVARLVRTRNVAGIRVTGSWYHDETRSLPYYLKLHFFNPHNDAQRTENSSQEFLFNLHNAKLIDAKFFEANQSAQGGQDRMFNLPPDCKLDQNS